MEKLYTIKFGERIKIDDIWDVWCGPGGWIFACGSPDCPLTTFVPFSDEFESK